ncbi:MAG: hypothetical protein ACI9S8_001598 [Chlamydiales bacterium]|jgi:hypothetical protein
MTKEFGSIIFLRVFSYFSLCSGIVCIRDREKERDLYLNKGSTIKWLIRHGERAENIDQKIPQKIVRVCRLATTVILSRPFSRSLSNSDLFLRPPEISVENLSIPFTPLVASRNMLSLPEEAIRSEAVLIDMSPVPMVSSLERFLLLFTPGEVSVEFSSISREPSLENLVPINTVNEVSDRISDRDSIFYVDRIYLEYDERESRRRNSRRLLGGYEVGLANIADLVGKNGFLLPNMGGEFFRRVNNETLNQAYPEEPNSLRHYMEIDGKVCFRPNHNGTHAARILRYAEILLDQIKAHGSEGGTESNAFSYLFGSRRGLLHNPELIIEQMLIATYLLRSGRIGEYGENHRTLERSASIYEAYAMGMGVEEETIRFMEAVIRCSTVTENVRNGLLPSMLLSL